MHVSMMNIVQEYRIIEHTQKFKSFKKDVDDIWILCLILRSLRVGNERDEN